MRVFSIFLLQLAMTTSAIACDCFSAEQRLKAAEDAFAKARLAVVGRVQEISASGIAKVQVLESFKGATKGELVEARQDVGLCTGASKGQIFTAGKDTFILSFGQFITSCDKLARDNFLLEGFRFIVKGK